MVFIPNTHGAKSSGVWTPLDLFPAEGVFWRFDDPANLHVTIDNINSANPTNGQDIGLAEDLSGNGKHLNGLTQAKSPTWNSTLKTATFSGSDIMDFTGLGIVGNQFTYVCGYTHQTAASSIYIASLAQDWAAGQNNGTMVHNENTNEFRSFTNQGSNDYAGYYSAAGGGDHGVANGEMCMFAFHADFTASTKALTVPVFEVNGANERDVITPLSWSSPANSSVVWTGVGYIGNSFAEVNGYIGNIGFILYIEGLLSDTDLGKIQTWANSIWPDIPTPP